MQKNIWKNSATKNNLWFCNFKRKREKRLRKQHYLSWLLVSVAASEQESSNWSQWMMLDISSWTTQSICVLQRKDRKAIAITPCAAEHPMSFKVPGRLLTDGQCRMMINGIQFIQVLLEANGLAAGKDHQFKGRYDAEKNAVIISLEKDEQSALSPQKCTT